jgi:hypothetical protein
MPSPSFRVFKDATGRHRWIAQSSTAFQDRDKEIVSTKALSDDCAFADQTGAYGPLRWWHTPGLDLGDCDFNAMHGRVLIESGTFRSAAIAQKVARAAAGLEISLGFIHLPTEPDAGGVFHHIRRFERSLVPRGKASNRFTAFTVKEHPMEDIKIAGLKAIGFDDDQIKAILGTADATMKAADAQGVAFKADEPELPDLVINGITYKAFPPPKAAAAGGMMEEEAGDAAAGAIDTAAAEELLVEEVADAVPALDAATVRAIVAEEMGNIAAQIMGALDLEKKVAGHVQGLMAPYAQAEAKKDAALAETKEQLEAVKGQLAELTGDQPAAPYRPSAAKDNVLTDATMLAAAKQLADPHGADPWADIKQGLGIARTQ